MKLPWCYRHNSQIVHMRDYVDNDRRVWCVVGDATNDLDYREDENGVQVGGCSSGWVLVTPSWEVSDD